MTDSTNPFAELTKMLEQFKLPGVDMSDVIESSRKDINALVEANQAATAAIQALARKQTDLLANAMKEVVGTAQQLTAQASAPDYAKQAELARDSYAKVMTELNDLTEIARKTQADTMSVITQRAEQSLDEMRKRMKLK